MRGTDTTIGEVPGGAASRLQPLVRELAGLELVYPGFERWLHGKVLPELGRSRSIFSKWHDDRLLGVVIAKADGVERKLCTVWTAPGIRGRGVGAGLMSDAIGWLGCDKPLISVPEERLEEFRSVFARRGFVETEALAGYYRPGCTEYVFNGRLTPQGSS